MVPRKVGFVYDEAFKQHQHPRIGNTHLEIPERVSAPYAYLEENGVIQKLVVLESRPATVNELTLVHDKEYINRLQNAKINDYKDVLADFDLVKDDKFSQTCFKGDTWNSYLHEKTYETALLSAGSALQLTDAVFNGDVDSGFALIRPPGHHAGTCFGAGFCYFNNVAIAARYAQQKGAEKIMIVDWDIHHGNGTQDIFYEDDRVLYLSLHRFYTYPGLEKAKAEFVGEKKGLGFNINIAWDETPMGDPEYKLAFEEIVLPVAQKYSPDLILVSCGFDAARGDPSGDFDVTINTYSWMTARLQEISKTVLFFEGGYDINNLCKGVYAVIMTLLGEYETDNIAGDANEIGRNNISTTKNAIRRFWF